MKLQENLEPTLSITLSAEGGTLHLTALPSGGKSRHSLICVQTLDYFAFTTKDLFKQFVHQCCPILLSQHTVPKCSLNGCFHWGSCLLSHARTHLQVNTVSQAHEKIHTGLQTPHNKSSEQRHNSRYTCTASNV